MREGGSEGAVMVVGWGCVWVRAGWVFFLLGGGGGGGGCGGGGGWGGGGGGGGGVCVGGSRSVTPHFL